MKSSMSFIASRRQFCSRIVLAALSAGFLAGCNTTAGHETTRPLYSAIIVNVEPVRAKNIGAFADKIGTDLKQALTKTYSGAVSTGNASLPTLTIEVKSIYFGSAVPDAAMGISVTQPMITAFRSSNDTLDGDAVIRKNGHEIKRINFYTTNTRHVHNPLPEEDGQERLVELTQLYADRLRQELGD